VTAPSLHGEAPGTLHRLWRRLPAGPRRRALQAAATWLAPRPDRVPPPPRGGIAVAGELLRPSGLGEAARLMLAGLEALGVATWSLPLASLPALGRVGSMPPDLPEGAPLLLHANAPVLPLAVRALPRAALRGRRVIGYWAWELPTVPLAWRNGAAFVHEVWTLSEFCRAALDPVLPGRVRTVPPPLAAAPPAPAPLDRAAFGLPPDAVIVLAAFSLASSFERKNPLAAIAAHRAAFGTRPDRLLVLKVSEPDAFPDDFRRLRAAVGEAPNIRLIAVGLPPADHQALIRCADIVLSLHRSEGLGLVPAEAMCMARPVVATGWSGNMAYMDAECAALVDYRLVPALDPRGVFEAPGARWAEPDIADAAGALQRLAGDPALRAALGARGRTAVLNRLGLAPLRAAVAALGMIAP
jgi:glycosyltransferase involved in cell wall biosynthesis